MDCDVKYPNISVNLIGENGNAFAIMGAVRTALRKAKVPHTEIKAFLKEAMSGDYNHLLTTCMKWVNVD